MSLANARATERRKHDVLVTALTRDPDLTEAEKELRRTYLDMFWEYGDRTPLAAAVDAYDRGDHEMMEMALADEEALSQLAQKAHAP